MATIVRDAQELGDAVRAARLDLGMSQAELARDARVGRQWLVGLEAGDKSSAPLNMVLRVLRELGGRVMLDPTSERTRPTKAALPPIRADDIIVRHTEPDPR